MAADPQLRASPNLETEMAWWSWMLVGLGLLAVEVAIPGGITLLFFGAAAVLVGSLVWLGIGGPVWFQWAMFSMLAVVSLLTLRGPILSKLMPSDEAGERVDSLVGKVVIVVEEIAPDAEGKVELRGAPWGAQNVGAESLAPGEKGIVERVEGLKLYIRRS